MSTGRFIREAVRSGQFRPQYLGRMTTAQIAALVPANYRTGTTVTCTDGVNAEREYKLQAGAFGVSGDGNSGGIRTIFAGDSFVELGLGNDTTAEIHPVDGSTYYSGGTFVESTDTSWFAIADARMGGPHQLVRNAGVGGNTIQDLQVRLQNDVLRYTPDRVVLNVGTNSVVADQSYATIVAAYTQLFDALSTSDVFIQSIMPRQIFTATQLNTAVTVNQWLAQQMLTRKKFYYINAFPRWADPLTGYPIAGKTYDGTHPTNVGAWDMATAYMAVAAPITPAWDYTPMGAAESYLLNTAAVVRNDNPLMAAGTGGTMQTGVTGAVAQNYDCGRGVGTPTVVASIIANPTGGGFRQRLVITYAAAGDMVYFGPPNLASRWLADTLLEGQCDMEIVAGSALVLCRATLSCGATVSSSGNTVRSWDQLAGRSPGTIPYVATGVTLRHRTPRLLMPAGACSTWNNRLNLYAKAAGTVTVDIWYFAARLIPKPIA